MKKILLFICLVIGTSSCQKFFLEKPDTTGSVDLEKIYSSTKNAEAALFRCYQNILAQGLPGGLGFGDGPLASISGELGPGYDWQQCYKIAISGLNASGNFADNFNTNWQYIRACFLVKENIHKVPDMDETMKTWIRGEATALVAYRYMGMFYRYGGLPIVRKAYLPDDDLVAPRMSVATTLDYIVKLCDEAYSMLPDSWDAIYTGRITKGVALAIKARALTYAARPLFNSATPYMEFAADSLICFGNVDPARWDAAIEANEDVLEWAAANGKSLIFTAGAGNRNTKEQAGADYAEACSEFNNRELLLAYKGDEEGNAYNSGRVSMFYNYSPYQQREPWLSENCGLTTNFLELYYDQDGGEINWPKIGEPAPRSVDDWVANIEKIEPRFRVDFCVAGLGGWANPNDQRWQPQGMRQLFSNDNAPINFPALGDDSGGPGCGFSTKFYFSAGARIYTEIPLFRLAETYLNLAEAYNEVDEPSSALRNLNMIHNRAGLPSITETNKDVLRAMIQREKAIEFFNENHRYYDVKHWKHPELETKILGGPRRELQFFRTSNDNLLEGIQSYWDAKFYEAYWHPRMFLEPIPTDEVNKGIILQNPGY